MLRIIGFSLVLFSVVSTSTFPSLSLAAEMPIEDAWKALPKYEYGKDMAALLTIDREVIRAMAAPASRSACAARLAALLEAASTTRAAKQYICLQLRQVGSRAEVPLLTRLLADPRVSQMARYALESIPGEESIAALRDAMNTLHGDSLIGVINSVAARKDVRSVAKLKELAGGKDSKVASAALWTLGNIANPEAISFIQQQVKPLGSPMPQNAAVPLLRCADAMASAGNVEQAQAIYVKLAASGQAVGVRRAALAAILQLQKEHATETVLSWINGADADRRVVASGRLAALSDAELDRLAAKLAELPDESQLGLIEVLALRKGKDALPLALSAARSDKLEMKLAGIRLLGQIGDASTITILTDSLAEGGKVAETAQQALCRLPREAVGKAMLTALAERPKIRGPVLGVLQKLKYYEAIDPLIAIASQEDPSVYEPALDALRGIADPDGDDLSRLVKLLLAVQGKHREEVERTILIVCQKSPDAAADRAKPVLAVLAKVDSTELPKYLPLLGRLGGPQVLRMIDSSLASENPECKASAIRALCNWPNAEVADRLWTIAGGDNQEFRQRALHAYVRVVTLKSDRPEAQTLAMLQKAMKLAKNAEDQQWVLSRASTVRTIDTVAWIAEYLDDPNLGQAACQAIVELAHHRFLRHPNMDRFGPLLEKVSRISKDPRVVERAKKYRLGL
jgi:HEAT repeat protein